MEPLGETIDLVMQALARQEPLRGPIEVILVDDGSSDNTAGVVEERCAELPLECRLVRHKRTFGRSCARTNHQRQTEDALPLPHGSTPFGSVASALRPEDIG